MLKGKKKKIKNGPMTTDFLATFSADSSTKNLKEHKSQRRKNKGFISPLISGVTSVLLSPVLSTVMSLPDDPMATPGDTTANHKTNGNLNISADAKSSHASGAGAKSKSNLSAVSTANCTGATQVDSESVSKKRKKDKTKGKNKGRFDRTAQEVMSEYSSIEPEPSVDEECSICAERLRSLSGFSGDPELGHVVCRLHRCRHQFHQACLFAMYDSGQKDGSLQCPTCKSIYGEKFGNCPAGRMEMSVLSQCLPGYTCDSIRIIYHILPGMQDVNHPNPGTPYTARGFPRHCYLPNNVPGRRVMSLLKIAWERRLTFTIGTSSTTGEQNTVTWNEIHHKTEFGSNRSGHGYPDQNYLQNVTYELAAQGVTSELLQSSS